MSYVMVKDHAINTNSIRNILLRQEWARQFLMPSLDNKIFINIDETWLNMTDFRRKQWRRKGTASSLQKKALNPRISLTVAISSKG